MLNLPSIAALTFDCYGTLIDWESGIRSAVRTVFLPHNTPMPTDENLLRLYADLEMQEECGGYQLYREVLAKVMDGIARRHGIKALTEHERYELANSLGSWPAFPDTAPFLRAAGKKYKLAICSNIDDDLFEKTRPKLGAPIDHVITAQRCGSYKPGFAHFRRAIELLDLQPRRILHVAESRRHDIEPAKKLGFQTAWVNRHKARPGPSASGEGDAVPDIEVSSLTELAELLGLTAEAR